MADTTVFRDARVIDGTGAAPVLADVEVEGERIRAVVAPGSGTGAASIDARGLVLAPGFIDVHTHDDIAVLAEPDHACKTLQGVTSVVVGNCGVSAAPASDHTRGFTIHERIRDYAAVVADAAPAVNVGALVGHGAVRAAVMGLRTDRAPDDAERGAMAQHVATAMDDGALGMSTGLAYEPGCYAEADEIAELAGVVAGRGGIYTTHMRDEGDGLLDSIRESIAVAEATGVPLQISHLKAAGRSNWGRVTEALGLIDDATGRGVDVMADQYPYTRGSTLLEQVVRAGALDGPSSFGHLSPGDILVASAPKHPDWEGKTVEQIAQDVDTDAREMAEEIVEREGRSCIVILDTMDEADVCAVMAHPAVMVGSDGVPGGSKPHPRLHHTYPRVLGHYVRGEAVLTLPDAIRRMTSLPAQRFGMADRGEVRAGTLADLVLFDPEVIIDTGTWSDPTSVPDGIVGVWVNGEQVVQAGAVTGARPGRFVSGPGVA